MAVDIKNNQDKLGFLNLLIVVLSVYVLIVLLIDTFFILPTEIAKIINLVDNMICFVFLYDFFVRLYKAENKLKFMKWGWIDLVSSIPVFDTLRAGRITRLIRLFRILRAFRSVKHLIHHIFKNRAQGTFSAAIIIAFLIVVFSSIAILQVETDANSNIKTAGDSLWWAFVTITTVGYGDKFPVTPEGRVIAVILMTVGVGLFGTFTGFVANWFMQGHKHEHTHEVKKEEKEVAENV